ncbi:MAG: LemA family protein [Bacteroidales bacterium]|nr:LemA family protein [Bacteroidales bacterium]MDE5606175.1 LemA family protein [Bacteroidales bacterium]MDE6106412.1 LemA family protein [Bacteroidales bacterium]MDE6113155.1 LemA family protein [Bacteroidales bacterium]MDE6440524.1 LemA family protein [Bacteroidales bacterium]
MKAKVWIVVLIVVVVLGMWMGSTYNKLVKAEEKVNSAWAQVENVYQRRADLIPNLVNTVKGAADFEQSTLTSVIEARAAATQVKITPENLTAESLAQFEQAQGQVSSALGRLMVTVERYPELKATQNFRDLQAQLEGTENRISVERKNFNEVVQVYNTRLRRFPTNLMAGMFGFEKKPYFAAQPGAETAPEVNFDFGK